MNRRDRVTQAMEVLFPASSRTTRRFELRFIELPAAVPTMVGGVDVTALPVDHASGAPAYALRVGCAGKVIAYSGDTAWTETLLDVARDADLFICEAYYHERIVKNHLSLKTLEQHLPEITPKKLVLTHMSDDMLGRLDRLPYTAASDGMVIEF